MRRPADDPGAAPAVAASGDVAGSLALRGGVVNLMGLLTRLVRPVFWILATRLHGAASVGEFAVAVSVLELARLVTSSGAADGVVRFVSLDTGRDGGSERISHALASAIWLSLGTGAVIAGLVTLGGHHWLAGVTRRPLLDHWLPVLVWSLPLLALAELLVAATRAHMVMRWNALLLGVLLPVLQLGFLVLLHLLGAADAALAWAWLLGAAGTTAAALTVFARYFDLPALLRHLRRPRWHGEMMRFAWPQNANMALNYFATNIDLVMLGMFGVPSAQLALYNAGVQLTRNLQGIKAAFGASFSPVVARFHADRRSGELATIFQGLSRLTLIAALVPVLVVFGLYRDLLLLFDPGFTTGTAFVLPLLGLPVVVSALGLASTLIVMSGFVGWNLFNGLLGGGLNILLNALLIPRAGLLGAALATLATALVVRAVTVVQARRLLQVRPAWSGLLGPLALGAASAGVLAVLVPRCDTLAARVLVVALVISGYVAVTLRTVLDDGERARLRREMARFRSPARGKGSP